MVCVNYKNKVYSAEYHEKTIKCLKEEVTKEIGKEVGEFSLFWKNPSGLKIPCDKDRILMVLGDLETEKVLDVEI